MCILVGSTHDLSIYLNCKMVRSGQIHLFNKILIIFRDKTPHNLSSIFLKCTACYQHVWTTIRTPYAMQEELSAY